MNNVRDRLRRSLPPSVSELPAEAVEQCRQRFFRLMEKRAAPGSERASAGENMALWWPKPPLIGRALPGGIASLDAEEGYDFDQRLESFFRAFGVDDVVFWAIGGEQNGLYRGPYNSDVRWWIKGELIVTPTVVLAMDRDIILVADDQFRFSVVGGAPQKLSGL